MEQFLGVAIVVVHHEILLVQEVGGSVVGQVEEFLAFGEIVHHQDVFDTSLVEGPDDIASNEIGAAGDYDYCGFPFTSLACFAARTPPRMAVVEQPSTNGKIVTRPPASLTQGAPAICSGL